MLKSNIINNRLYAEYNIEEPVNESTYEDKEIERLLSLDTVSPSTIINAYGRNRYIANKYIRESFNYLKSHNFDSSLCNLFEANILNKISNNTFKQIFTPEVIGSVKEQSEDMYNLLESNRHAIIMVDNHNSIKESYNTDNIKDLNNKAFIWKICNEVSKDNSIDATTKAIIAIEDVSLIGLGKDITSETKQILEYFIYNKEDIDYDKLNEYFNSINIISVNGSDEDNYMITPPKGVVTISDDPVVDDIDVIFAKGVSYIPYNLSNYINAIVAKLNRNSISLESLGKANTILKDRMYTILNTANEKGISIIDNISSIIIKGIKLCDDTIAMNQNMDAGFIHNFISFKEFLVDLNGFVNDFNDIKYDYTNEMAVAIMNESFKDIISNITTTVANAFIGDNGIFNKFKNIKDKISLRKFKTHKAKNLITLTTNIDKQIRDRMECYRKNGLKGVFSALKRKFMLKEDMDITDKVLAEMVTADGNIMVSVGDYIMEFNIDKDDIEYFEELCKVINRDLTEGMVFYICNENEVSFIYRDMLTEIDLTDEEEDMLESYMDDEQIGIATYLEAFANLNEITLDSLTSSLCYANGNEFNTVLELFSILGVSKENVYDMYERVTLYKSINENTEDYIDFKLKTDYNVINYTENNIEIEDDMDLLEGYTILSSIVEKSEDEWKGIDLDDEDKEDDKKKKPVEKKELSDKKVEKKDNKSHHIDSPKDKEKKFKGINLNNIKLYIAGIKDKAKNLSAKEKSISRSADTAFNMFVQNLQRAMVSDRREAIIKGSVIPSFSKSIKIALGLAGLGVATGGPAVPIIAALGAFACSKNLTKKERALLLDDIVIEIEVLDKEIQVAENNNNYKKMRELMKTKRELERQYARIQYNVRVGKDIIPSRNADS